MTALLDSLIHSEEQTATARADYWRLVAQLAAGTDDPTLTDFQATLAAAAKSTADLKADVRTYQLRSEQKA